MITFKIVKKKSPTDSTVQKFYPVLLSSGYTDLDNVAARISEVCTVSVHDVKGVLQALEQQLSATLQEGKSVRLGTLGSFHIRVNSKRGGKTSADDVKTDDVASLRIHFSKSPRLRRAFKRTNSALKFRQQA